ncbi:MAG TPA: hypothetical protein VMM18_04690 [Gemmatimonadaceae bacterium]|nr:hypothetical protein [Gemmatimonadaceae bacterium]
MPSPLKRWLYRVAFGYRIGSGVRFGFGSVIIGDDVELADHVELGFLAIVQGRRIRIGRYSSVGAQSYVSCNVIEIGEDARIREQVFVGGPQLPESRFTLGSRTIVLQLTYINPTMPIAIGDDSGIGGHCLIFTHGSWLSVLEGYPVTYEPVTIGRSVWLPWRVFVMPGSVIGDGAVIGANSLVAGTIPASTLAVGSPAKVVRQPPDFPRRLSDDERRTLVDDMIVAFERFAESEGATVTRGDGFTTYRYKRRPWRLVRAHSAATPPDLRAGDTLLAEVALSPAERPQLRERGVFWIDLARKTRSDEGSPLTEELVLFLSRYGIRPARE